VLLALVDGSRRSADVVKQGVERAARRAQLRESGVHRLRHTFCSHLAMHGPPARAIQELPENSGPWHDTALHALESGD
jgi:site-specific recombinase XerD